MPSVKFKNRQLILWSLVVFLKNGLTTWKNRSVKPLTILSSYPDDVEKYANALPVVACDFDSTDMTELELGSNGKTALKTRSFIIDLLTNTSDERLRLGDDMEDLLGNGFWVYDFNEYIFQSGDPTVYPPTQDNTVSGTSLSQVTFVKPDFVSSTVFDMEQGFKRFYERFSFKITIGEDIT